MNKLVNRRVSADELNELTELVGFLHQIDNLGRTNQLGDAPERFGENSQLIKTEEGFIVYFTLMLLLVAAAGGISPPTNLYRKIKLLFRLKNNPILDQFNLPRGIRSKR